MTGLRVGLLAVLGLTAYVVQTSVLAPLGLPGATPDPLLLVVVGLAQAWGAVDGAVAGFAAGVLADLLPPADGPLGRDALVLTLVGFLIGRAFQRAEPAPLPTLAAVAVAAPAAVVASSVLAALIGQAGLPWSGVPLFALTGLAYELVLAPLVVPVVVRLARSTATPAEVRL